jgi:hypothetical protein
MKALILQLEAERTERSEHYEIKNANREPENDLEEQETDS